MGCFYHPRGGFPHSCDLPGRGGLGRGAALEDAASLALRAPGPDAPRRFRWNIYGIVYLRKGYNFLIFSMSCISMVYIDMVYIYMNIYGIIVYHSLSKEWV